MKISLVFEDIGAGPQVILSTDNPDEAQRFYKAHKSEVDSKIYLVVNPPVVLHRKIKTDPKPVSPKKK